MKLTGLLKNKVEEAQTKEDKKAIVAEAGMELTDEELEGVAGGRMTQSLYVYGVERIQSSNIAQALKEKAHKELEKMRTSSTDYSPTDVEAMLHKRGIL